MTPRQEIIGQVAAALAVGAPAGTTIHRQPMRPIEKDQLPAICIYALSVRPLDQRHGLRPYSLQLRIECRFHGHSPDSDLEPWVAHCQQVMTRCRPAVSDLVTEVEEGEIQYDALAADRTYVAAALDYTLTYHHDQTGQGPDPWNDEEMP